MKNVRIKCAKFDTYLNTPKNEDFAAVDAAPFDVPVAVYEDEVEVDTTMQIMSKILGVKQAFKTLSCNNCRREIVEVVSTNKAVCCYCKLQQASATCNVNWNLQNESKKTLQLRLDNTATETLLHMLNAIYDLQLATEDDIVATILENFETFYYFTYDCLTAQVNHVS